MMRWGERKSKVYWALKIIINSDSIDCDPIDWTIKSVHCRAGSLEIIWEEQGGYVLGQFKPEQ